MRSQRKRRLIFIIALLIAFSISLTLVLFALRNNIDLYYTPSELITHQVKPSQKLRLGGLVVKGSVHHNPQSLAVSFVLTDFHDQVKVEYVGILPSLFREGQGIVAQGVLQKNGVFIADQVLAKHDENYHPPKINFKDDIKRDS